MYTFSLSYIVLAIMSDVLNVMHKLVILLLGILLFLIAVILQWRWTDKNK